MADETKEAPAPKQKAKPDKVKLKLVRAGSCNYDGLIIKKNGIIELETSRAEEFMKSGLFEKL